ncbi:Integrase [Neorhodopirellula lusitana]|uniref:Integrase n=1 Tax=Neorhodopirellula lusitana TaxID=445327 RepID=A0ABY1PQD7_9BACT|nr:Integrase [Neorhodopirellula lusitana]
MASITKEEKNGRTYYRLRVIVGGKVHRINLGFGHSQRALSKILEHASDLEALHKLGEKPDIRLMSELNEKYSTELLDKLSKIGLIAKAAPKLEKFLTDYIDSKSDVGEHAIYKLNNTKRLLINFFGDVRIGTISSGSVEDYRLARLKLVKPSTVGTETKHGKQFFAYAVRKGYISENPFKGFVVKAQVDEERRIILDTTMLTDIVNRTTDKQWQLFLAVVRWTGCRQSEALLLKWSDIQWDVDRIKMPSSKTKHMGKPFREVPLFPELYPLLLEASENAPSGSVYVVDGIVKPGQRSGRLGKNMGKPFQSLIKQLGYEPWAKPYQNIRVTRENELIGQGHPAHVVQRWLGHSSKVSEKHYLDVSDDDFAKALKPAGGQIVVGKQKQADAEKCNELGKPAKTRALHNPAPLCDCSQKGLAPPAGLEPATRRLTAACSTN